MGQMPWTPRATGAGRAAGTLRRGQVEGLGNGGSVLALLGSLPDVQADRCRGGGGHDGGSWWRAPQQTTLTTSAPGPAANLFASPRDRASNPLSANLSARSHGK